MKVHLAETGDHVRDLSARDWRTQAATSSRHRFVDDPHAADVLLFTQPHMLQGDPLGRVIARHPLVRSHRDRCYVYDQRDRPWSPLPGLFVSLPASRFDHRRHRAVPYYKGDESDFVARRLEMPDLLFSLVGAVTHPCRAQLFALRHPDAVVQSTGAAFNDGTASDAAARRERFVGTTLRSHFVLCPRGHGTSSFRLYEVLAAGRVPVIIADEWVPPSGPDWWSFALRWPEGRTAGLADELTARMDEWPERAARAIDAYDRWFAPAARIDRVVDELADLVRITHSPRRRRPLALRDSQYRRFAARHAADGLAPVGASVRRILGGAAAHSGVRVGNAKGGTVEQ